jgi:positive regulator of sigma E activity
MTLLNLNRIVPGRDEFASQTPACSGCSGCADRPQSVSLSQVRGDSVVIELSLNAQLEMLWNSWLKPLFAMVMSALGCVTLGVSEPLAVGIALVAFVAGYLVCYAVPQHALKISENLL